jgi:microcystin-dependent protein
MEEYLGIIKLFAGNFAPRGWALCNGQLLSIAQNSALFAILGTAYGGDGVTTFALPDMRVRDSANPNGGTNYVGIEGMPQMCYIICMQGIFPSRN